MNDDRYIETKCLICDLKDDELGIKNDKWVDVFLDLTMVSAFRKNTEDYENTVSLYNEDGEHLFMIDISYNEFKMKFLKYKSSIKEFHLQ